MKIPNKQRQHAPLGRRTHFSPVMENVRFQG